MKRSVQGSGRSAEVVGILFAIIWKVFIFLFPHHITHIYIVSIMGMCHTFNLLAAPPCKEVIHSLGRSIPFATDVCSGAQWSYILALCKFCVNVLFYFICLLNVQ